MQNRNLRLLLASIGVVVIATLVLMTSLWPDSGKTSGKKTLPAGVANANSATANRGLATASNPASGNVIASNTATPPITKKKEANGVLVTPPIREELTKGFYRDSKTGEMKEMPVTVQIMMVRDPDGKPSVVPASGKNSLISGDSPADPNAVKIDATNSGAKKSDK